KPVLTESTYKGLSGVRGNSHAPFLGGGGAAMCRCYPTGRQDNTAVVRIRAAEKRTTTTTGTGSYHQKKTFRTHHKREG
ncbi:hypothetical protein NOI36_23685, partial [Escherichia coli]|uniref:hypothetical protein n=1 Tax=Escherichia coli TaxID=562 RepID=UPI0028755C6A